MSKRKADAIDSNTLRKRACEEAYRDARPITFLCKHKQTAVSTLLWIYRHEENCHIASIYQLAKEDEDITCDVFEFTQEVVVRALEFLRSEVYHAEENWHDSKEGQSEFVDVLRFFLYIGIDETVTELEKAVEFKVMSGFGCGNRFVSFIHTYATRNLCSGYLFNALLKHVGDRVSGFREYIGPAGSEYDKTFTEFGLYRRMVLGLGDE
jgi:hypothetical protein